MKLAWWLCLPITVQRAMCLTQFQNLGKQPSPWLHSSRRWVDILAHRRNNNITSFSTSTLSGLSTLTECTNYLSITYDWLASILDKNYLDKILTNLVFFIQSVFRYVMLARKKNLPDTPCAYNVFFYFYREKMFLKTIKHWNELVNSLSMFLYKKCWNKNSKSHKIITTASFFMQYLNPLHKMAW